MKLINEKEVEEACGSFIYSKRHGFKDGVSFAEEKLTPLMIEFADYVYREDIGGSCLNTEHLLEQFLKSKKDEK